MSDKRSSIIYAPVVQKLINQCRGMDRPYRIVTEEILEDEKTQKWNVVKMRMTIVVDGTNYVRHYWG